MRKLLILRGLPGAGKSTFIKEHNLEEFVLSADSIRTLFSPAMVNYDKDYGFTIGIPQTEDVKTWNLLFEVLEERMKKGAFTVIDATSIHTKTVNKYKKLAQTYRYRIGVVDLTDYPVELVKAQNWNRYFTKEFVPERVINRMNETIEPLGNAFKRINNDEELTEFLTMPPIDYTYNQNGDEYEKVFFIGDIHGCYDPLHEFLQEHFDIPENPKNLYIFLGDYLDRGFKNAEVFNEVKRLVEYPNTLFLEGNHEAHLREWAKDEEIRSAQFTNHTVPELEEAGITKKDAFKLYFRFAQMAYFTFHGKTFLASHGGITMPYVGDKLNPFLFDRIASYYTWLPQLLVRMNTEQFIHGVGHYEDAEKLAESWKNIQENKNNNKMYSVPNPTIQVFGHRNVTDAPIKMNDYTYCLEGHVEQILNPNGRMRVLEYNSKTDEFIPHEYANPLWNKGFETVTNLKNAQIIKKMRALPQYIKEVPLHDDVASFNFTEQAFWDRRWDTREISMARGLFMDTKTYEVVARSYDKFFKLYEVKANFPDTLEENLKFPVQVYEKYNGFLGILSCYNDELLFFSKANSTKSDKPKMAKLFEKTFKSMNPDLEGIKNFLKDNNVTMVFECVTREDPHIISIEDGVPDRCILLNVIENRLDEFSFGKWGDIKELNELGEKFGLPVKKLANTYTNFRSLWYQIEETSDDCQMDDTEGYVYEDATGYMFKLKTPYYNFWKLMRSTVGKLRSIAKKANGHPVKLGRMPQVLNDGAGHMFTNSVKKQYRRIFKKFAEFIDEHQEVLTDSEKYSDIIKIRNEFDKWVKENPLID